LKLRSQAPCIVGPAAITDPFDADLGISLEPGLDYHFDNYTMSLNVQEVSHLHLENLMFRTDLHWFICCKIHNQINLPIGHRVQESMQENGRAATIWGRRKHILTITINTR
jgi:hypothetical protein